MQFFTLLRLQIQPSERIFNILRQIIHLFVYIHRHAQTSSQFFSECDTAEKWMKDREDQLNTHFAQSEFKLDEGENLLKEMQHLRDELSQYEDEVQRLIETAGEIVPLRARRERLRQPIEAVAICKYQSSEVRELRDFL